MNHIKRELHTHLIGVGGIGMSAVAQVLRSRGDRVSGCDIRPSPLTAKLEGLGIAFSEGHSPAHLAGVTRVVVSDAIRHDSPELLHARELNLPVLRRSQLVGELMAEKRGIAVAGTHGKTTTTAMVGFILAQAGLDPTVLVGGELPAFGGNARIGSGDFFVAEACEAYESFLDLEPEIAVVTNVEAEHLDHHKSEQGLIESFAKFLGNIRDGGRVVFCADDPRATSLAIDASAEAVSYGTAAQALFRAVDIGDDGLGMRFVAVHPHGRVDARLPVPGRHSVLNALGAMAACALAGVNPEQSVRILECYGGVERRFQVTTTASGVTVVDDYAHHPTEVRAVMATARPRCTGALVVVFQPHLYSRTRDFLDAFADALALADRVIVTDAYAAREEPSAGLNGDAIVEALRKRGKEDTHFRAQKDEVAGVLSETLSAGDWVLVLGAGDIGSVAVNLVERLGRCTPAQAVEGRPACTG
ncbi:MAG: UDP-N-acetylmuramate--L-alanine ligase [Armatimonadota bacterium]|nr:MAG: UDP-N-acetylmuramate--L-alanine ligase [Armatimonadota bacterium]